MENNQEAFNDLNKRLKGIINQMDEKIRSDEEYKTAYNKALLSWPPRVREKFDWIYVYDLPLIKELLVENFEVEWSPITSNLLERNKDGDIPVKQLNGSIFILNLIPKTTRHLPFSKIKIVVEGGTSRGGERKGIGQEETMFMIVATAMNPWDNWNGDSYKNRVHEWRSEGRYDEMDRFNKFWQNPSLVIIEIINHFTGAPK